MGLVPIFRDSHCGLDCETKKEGEKLIFQAFQLKNDERGPFGKRQFPLKTGLSQKREESLRVYVRRTEESLSRKKASNPSNVLKFPLLFSSVLYPRSQLALIC